MHLRKHDLGCIAAVKNLIDEAPLRRVTIEFLADHTGISRNKLINGFKRQFGCTIEQYHTAARLERIKELLSRGELTIKEIAVRAGYKPSHFSFLFRQKTGLSPTEWQHRQHFTIRRSVSHPNG